jgi:hypothetical protein
VKLISKWLGHESVAVTLAHYGNWIKETQKLAEDVSRDANAKMMAKVVALRGRMEDKSGESVLAVSPRRGRVPRAKESAGGTEAKRRTFAPVEQAAGCWRESHPAPHTDPLASRRPIGNCASKESPN